MLNQWLHKHDSNQVLVKNFHPGKMMVENPNYKNMFGNNVNKFLFYFSRNLLNIINKRADEEFDDSLDYLTIYNF